MKKLILSYLMLFSLSTFSQEEISNEIEQENPNAWEAETDKAKPTFTFDKIVLAKLEKELKYSDYYSEDQKTLYAGARIVKDKSTKVDEGQYVKLSSIPEAEKFVYVSKGANYLYLIRNVKTKELYALHTFTINYADYSSASEHKNLVKESPIPLSVSQQELLSKYKSLIKNANANITLLQGIQKKSLTRGYFDASKVNALDKKSYNKNLTALKSKIDQITDIRKYEDKDKIVQDKLTLTELGQISNITSWDEIEILD